MSTISIVQLVAPSQLGNADASLYQTPTNSTVRIGSATFCNTTAGALTLTAGITTGGAMTAATTLISAFTLAPGQSYTSPQLAGQVMPAGSQLHAYASAATSITVAVSGIIIQ